MKRFKVNRIIKYLILSDLAFWSGWGLVTPIFAIFIVERIEGGSVFIAGAASAAYWIFRSLFRVPVSFFLDKCSGEKDDYWFLTVGLFIASLVPFGFVFATKPIHIYILQVVYALGVATSASGWSPIFTRYLDRGREATQWGLSGSSYGIGIGITGMIGGWAVMRFGFNPVFITVGVMGLLGVIFLLCLKDDIKGVFDKGIKMDFKDIFDGEDNESGNI
jgi:hypothetical protein